MRQLSKGLLERVLEAGMTEHPGHDSGGAVVNMAIPETGKSKTSWVKSSWRLPETDRVTLNLK